MHNNRRFVIIPIILVVALAAGIWYINDGRAADTVNALTASGTVESIEVILAPEIGGRVLEVMAEQGDRVESGDPLLRLDDELLQSQRKRAEAAVEAAVANQTGAQAGLEMAQAGLGVAQAALASARIAQEGAQVQYDITINAARQADQPARAGWWVRDLPNEFEQPAWYYEKSEAIAAAEWELGEAGKTLLAERNDYESLMADPAFDDLHQAESRLSEAQAAFVVAQEILRRAQAQPDQEVEDYAQSVFDSAEAELSAAQVDYERMLSEEQFKDVREARARVAVAVELYQIAWDQLNRLLTGEQSLQVRVAEIAVNQAGAAVAQAEASTRQAEVGVKQAVAKVAQADSAVLQAQAELDLIDAQLSRLVVFAPQSGVILNRNVEPGEIVQPGTAALILGRLEDLSITVYLPEDRYGAVRLGDMAQVRVDSFPGEVFFAEVVRIADRAEFTPRNVQTADGRRTTVYAVELAVSEEGGKLKPGMPADITFE